MKRVFSLALILGLAAVQSASAATVFYDFGDSGRQTPGNNNIIMNLPAVLNLANSVDSTGASTGIAVNVSGFFMGSNTTGATAPTGDAAAIFNAEATRDNAFGHALAFGMNPLTPQGTVTFSGLDASGATAYDFTIFAGRIGINDIRDARYDLNGASSTSVVLDASNNVSQVVTAAGIIPNSNGVITLLASPGPNNTSASKFYFLGAVRIVSGPAIPEPTSLVIAALAGAGLLFRRR